jgi:hypothetical protein
MSYEPNNFQDDMQKFIQMLKKLLKSNLNKDKFSDNDIMAGKNGDINVNVFFMPFLSMSPEDMDELEDIYDECFDEDKSREDIDADLTKSDIDFLRKNGIRF